MSQQLQNIASLLPTQLRAGNTCLRLRYLVGVLAIGMVFYAAAAAGHSGFFAKWAFGDGTQRSALGSVDGTAERPFIYRQLVPRLAVSISQLVSAERKEHIVREGWMKHFAPQVNYARSKPLDNVEQSFVYQVMFFISFAGLFLALLVMYRWCRDLGCGLSTSVLAPVIFAIFYPVFMTRGGYWYDSVEVLLLMSAAWLAVNGHWIGLLMVSAIAPLNKEAYIFFVPTLYPLLRARLDVKKSLLVTVACCLIAGGAHAFVRQAFSGNSGQGFEFHLWENLAFYANPLSYLGQEANYGVPMPRGVAVPNLAILGLLVVAAWKYVSNSMRQHAFVALAVNLPLLVLFCWRDELRNLSMLYPTLVTLLGLTLAHANGELSDDVGDQGSLGSAYRSG